MRNLLAVIVRWLRSRLAWFPGCEECGQSLIEYLLLAFIIAFTCVAAASAFGSQISTWLAR